jgi:hypothetical protein
MTVAQQLIEEGFLKGIEIGIEQGIEQGIERGIKRGIERGERANARRLAGNLLRLRFGELSPEVIVRLDQADLETLNGWAEGVLFAESLEGLLGS